MTRRTTGMVLEVRSDSVVLLTREGIFLEVPRSDVRADAVVGTTVPLTLSETWFAPVPDHQAGRRWRHPAFRRALAAVAAAVIVSGLGLALYRQATMAAYEVAVEINPGVVLTINARDRVVRAQPTNADGEAVLAVLDLRGESLADAVRALVRTAHELGFLAVPPAAPISFSTLAAAPSDPGLAAAEVAAPPDGAGPTVAISIIPHSGVVGPQVVERLADTLHAAAEETGTTFEAVVQVISGDELREARQVARGGSIAKAALAQQARSRGMDITDDELTRTSVPDLARRVKDAGSPEDPLQRYRLDLFRVQPGPDDDDDRQLRRHRDRPPVGRGNDRPHPGRGRGEDGGDDERPGLGRGRHRPGGDARGAEPGRGRGPDREPDRGRQDRERGSDDDDRDERPGRGRGRDDRRDGRGDEWRGPGRGQGGPGNRDGDEPPGRGRRPSWLEWPPSQRFLDGFRNRR